MTEKNNDLIDQLATLSPDSLTYEARHFRDKVLKGTQASFEALFDPNLQFNLHWRYLVAIYATKLSKSTDLSQYYVEQAKQHAVDVVLIDAVQSDTVESVEDAQLKAVLAFTKKLILKPIEGDKEAVQSLQKAGLSPREIVALSQLIAFLSYQLRLFAGVKAMQAWEQR